MIKRISLYLVIILCCHTAKATSLGVATGQCNMSMDITGVPNFKAMSAPVFYSDEYSGTVKIPEGVKNLSDPRLKTNFEKQCVFYYRAICIMNPVFEGLNYQSKVKSLDQMFDLSLVNQFVGKASEISGFSQRSLLMFDANAAGTLFKNLTCHSWKGDGDVSPEWGLDGKPGPNSIFPFPNNLIPDLEPYHGPTPQTPSLWYDFNQFLEDLSDIVLPMGIAISVGVLVLAATAGSAPTAGGSVLAAFIAILVLVWPYMNSEQQKKYEKYYSAGLNEVQHEDNGSFVMNDSSISLEITEDDWELNIKNKRSLGTVQRIDKDKVEIRSGRQKIGIANGNVKLEKEFKNTL